MSESQSRPRRPFTFDRVIRILFAALVVICAMWLINYLRNVLLPFLVACLIAYLLEPALEFNQKLLHLKGRVIATFVTLFEVTFFIGVIGYFCIPSVMSELAQMGSLLKSYYTSDVELPMVPEQVHVFLRKYLNPERLAQYFDVDHIETLLDKGTSLVSESIEILIHFVEWLLMFIYVIFIMIDYPHLSTGCRMMVPPKMRPVVYRLFHDMKVSMDHYFRGQSFLALCAALFYSVGFSIVGIPLSIVLGVTVGILYLIPYFQYVTLIPVTIVCIIYSMGGEAHFWTVWSECILVYVVSQCTCDYILTPKVMGKVMGLNPAIILLSLSVWGSLMGLIGMLIALPLTTLIISYYERYVILRRPLPTTLPPGMSAPPDPDPREL
ncbi:MAG: AI-2E family transporter [Firmicutes bacterium]|nr:AI-2E family transporter [Bacillota bacterium]MCM1400896.1 AI-2E family transporter [Bacteroides sp.]MCM1476270.1 AI-2E family transporter [Bacteroides sp.]